MTQAEILEIMQTLPSPTTRNEIAKVLIQKYPYLKQVNKVVGDTLRRLKKNEYITNNGNKWTIIDDSLLRNRNIAK